MEWDIDPPTVISGRLSPLEQYVTGGRFSRFASLSIRFIRKLMSGLTNHPGVLLDGGTGVLIDTRFADHGIQVAQVVERVEVALADL